MKTVTASRGALPSQFEKHWVRVRDVWKEGIFEAPHYSVFTAKLALKHTSVIKKCQRRVLQLALRVELTIIANSKISHTTIKFEIEYYKQNLKKIIVNL